MKTWIRFILMSSIACPVWAKSPPAGPIPVTVDNFVRAESDLYFGRQVKEAGLGKFHHNREMTPIDQQKVVRMNRDTLYSSGIFDLEAAPVTILLPDPGKRYVSMQVFSQDHYTIDVAYAPGRHTYTREKVGTRYMSIAIRTLANPQDPADMKAAHELQDKIEIEQTKTGTFEIPVWDPVSQGKVRELLEWLGQMGGKGVKFGKKTEVDPISHLIGTAVGWGGNPPSAAVYEFGIPKQNDGKKVHTLTVKDVPVDSFWSLSVYNAKGYFEKNDLDAYSVNNLTAKPNPNGSVTVQFGGCQKDALNCLPIMSGWNYVIRLYRPRVEILNGTWKFPEAQPVK